MTKFKLTRDIKAALATDDMKIIKKELCGDFLSSGVYRDVYALNGFPDHVIKIERKMSTCMFCNVTEFRNWVNHREWTWFSPWLAPVEMITHDGSILVMQRVSQDRPRKEYPKRIPALLTDTKVANYGWIGDRFVCCDYAFLLQLVITDKRPSEPMRRARWWGTLKHLSK